MQLFSSKFTRLDTRRREKGLTLLEVLITLLVVSVGLLGIAGLQLVSVQSAVNSNLQTHAMMLSQDLIERIRANRDVVLDSTGGLDITAYRKAPGTAFPAVGDLVTGCYDSTGCTKEEMAISDLVQWSNLLQQSLPISAGQLTANVAVCIDKTTDTLACDDVGSAVKIALTWSESTVLDANAPDPAAVVQNYIVSFEP